MPTFQTLRGFKVRRELAKPLVLQWIHTHNDCVALCPRQRYHVINPQGGNKRTEATDMKKLDKELTRIAKEHLDLETLETRRSDSLDFHDCSVWGIKAALEAAYKAGLAAGEKKGVRDDA